MNKYWRWLICTVLLLVIVSGGCAGGGALQISNHELTVRQFTGDLNSTRSMAVVTGLAKNIGSVPLSDCNISVRYLDADRNLVGAASAYKQLLEPGETWNFTVQLTAPDAWKVRSYDISSASR